MRTSWFVVSGSLVVLSACGGGGAGNLKKTAAVDLNCTPKQIEVEQLQKARNGIIYQANGCGRTAQYSVVKKTVTRTSEITDYTPPPPPERPVETATPAPAAAPPPQQQGGFTPEQQAAFFAAHDARMDAMKQNQQQFFAGNGTPQQPPPPPQNAPAPAPAPVATQSSNEQVGWVCVNGDYFTCPTVASTTALAGYAKCRMTCMMGGNCKSCVVGEGEKCDRVPSRDNQCKK